VRTRGQHEANTTMTQVTNRGLRTAEQPPAPTSKHTDDTAEGMELKPCPAPLMSSLAAEAEGPRGMRQWGGQEGPPLAHPRVHRAAAAAKAQGH